MRALSEHAGISTETIRRHRNDLETIGLLEIEDHGPGQATLYRLRLPFRAERDDAAAPRPRHLMIANEEMQTQSIRAVVRDLLDACVSR
jgi:predicted ArsR family transcriptional regulator